MRIELLHIEDCPGWTAASRTLEAVLDDLRLPDAVVERRLLTAADDLRAARFAGSPTVLIDGEDAVAGSAPVDELACRVYSTADGLAPAPSYQQIREAVARALGTVRGAGARRGTRDTTR